MSEREDRFVVMVRPRGVGPSWWPQAVPCPVSEHMGITVVAEGRIGSVVQFIWQTATEGGGVTGGVDLAHAVAGDEELAQRVEDWFDEHEDDPWPWAIAQVRLPD